ncbi:hypothetical protein ACOCG7_10630 [Paraburkholderia sp. DD10]|uniref:hypothetical protein n=1 Tax=Paraburkholderia sp. DD10 TaxID=3409691 RepID=UPI003BA20A4E
MPKTVRSGSIGIFLYIASILLPAFAELDSAHKLLWWKGHSVLAMGWLGIFNFQFAWFGDRVIAPGISGRDASGSQNVVCRYFVLAFHDSLP